MKHIMLTLMAALMLVACGSKNQYTLNVQLSDDQVGTMVYLYDIVSQQPLDSLRAESTTVAFCGEVATPFAAMVRTQGYYGICFIEPGTIELNPVVDALSGTPLNEKYAAAMFAGDVLEAQTIFNEKLPEYNALDPEAQRTMLPLMDSLYNNLMAASKQAFLALFENNLDNVLGAYAFSQLADTYQSAQEMEQALSKASDMVKNYPPVKERLEQLRVLDATAVGKLFVDFEGTDYATGETTSLAKLIEGKLALVDVWASWCGPCRQEIRDNMVRLHKQYAPKGLFVLGIDVNDKPEAHKKATEELGIAYHQLIDNKGVCCNLYGINGIPHIMLIGPDGTILARDLRGDAIEEAILQHLQ